MALFPMVIGGGSFSEITLWTNSSPTSSMTSTDVTLDSGKKISDYTLIGIEFRMSTSISTSSSVIVKVSDFVNMSGSGHNMFMIGLYGQVSSTNYIRGVRYVSDTVVNFLGAGSTSGTQNHAMMIPIRIYGLK